MKTFEQHFKDANKNLEDHEYRHFNRAMGIPIYSKEHYKIEMKKRGLVPDAMVDEMREDYLKKNQKKKYELSPKAREVVSQLESMRGRNKGMVRLCEYPKLVEAMKEVGLDYERSYEEYLN